VLELRVHGIANSPPADVLCATAEEIERKEGDDLGSFWRIKPTASDPAEPPSADLDPGVEKDAEAYSWGNQARSGGSALVLIGRAIVHLGWLFVLPFGLCNLAYWARRDIKGADEGEAAAQEKEASKEKQAEKKKGAGRKKRRDKDRRGDRTLWAGGDGAVLIRIFALLQTLFYMVGFLTVFVHLIGLQCFRAAEGEACAVLPRSLDFLGEWSSTARSALFSIVPILVILLIYIIGLRARGMFNAHQSFDDTPKPRPVSTEPVHESDPPRPPLLASPGFWQRSRVAQTSERSHLAAAFALTLTLLAWDAVLDSLPAREDIAATLSGAFSIPGAAFPLVMSGAGALALIGAFVMAAAAGFSGKRWSRSSKRGWSTVILVFSVAAYVAWVGWALIATRDDVPGPGQFPGDSQLRGLIVTPTVIAASCALIAVSSVSWGYAWRRRLVNYALLPLALMCALLSAVGPADSTEELGWMRPSFGWATAAIVVAAVVVGYLPFRDAKTKAARRFSAWHGNGASVALLLALFCSLVITSLLVLGAHAWLTTNAATVPVSGIWRRIERPTTDSIPRPPFHEQFAGMIIAMLLIFLVAVMIAAVAALRRFPAFSLPGPHYDPKLGGVRDLVKDRASVGPTLDDTAPKIVPKDEYPPSEIKPVDRLRAVADARRVAGLAHRGEPLLRVLAILTAFALVPLAIPFFRDLIQAFVPEAWGALATAGGWALGLLGLAAAAWVVTNAVTSTERPLGLVWDIICFFPRAGHPFTPPCYAERAVPEVTKRILRHITQRNDDPNADDGKRVILSAHSMGATIAIGSILELYGKEETAVLDRVALLTHGAQLRPYFSRFFPEVFGPAVLGISGTRGPSLLRADPWHRQVIDDHDSPALPPHNEKDPPSVAQILTRNGDATHRSAAPRWRSLWRRTDFLGFPITSYWSRETNGVNENPIDRGASERSPRSYLWTIARHNDYVSTAEYKNARHELIELLKGEEEAVTLVPAARHGRRFWNSRRGEPGRGP
ncbi:MAG: hypothetical protein ABWY23_11025, partial [Mycetocola sp.]